MTDPRETLARIRAQADAATEGPWAWASRTTVDGDQWAVFDKQDHALAENRDGWGPDAEFIAAARTDVPRLVDALEKVLELHVRAECPTCGSRDGEGNEFHKCDDDAYCEECDLEGYPCPTVEAITAVLEGDPR